MNWYLLIYQVPAEMDLSSARLCPSSCSIMQRLSDQAHIVKCFHYHPKPTPADCASHKTMLVMELMEVRSQLAH